MYLILFIITYFFNYLSIMKDEAHGRMMISKSEEGNGGDHPTGFDFDWSTKHKKPHTKGQKGNQKVQKALRQIRRVHRVIIISLRLLAARRLLL